MSNIFDYMIWRGDLSFSASRFNEVDNLIFAMLAYIDFTGVVPAPGNVHTVSLADAAAGYAAKCAEHKQNMGVLVPEQVPKMLEEMAKCQRYSEASLSDFVNHIDFEKEEQFSALTIDLGCGTVYISFCGTDDTIVGWKENFNMSFSDVVPAQREALRYLENAARARKGQIIVGGHSKGGNLAVYSAMYSSDEIKERIVGIFNNDGPGFHSSVLDTDEYVEIRGRVCTLLPESSMVGMIMEHEEEYEVVKSSGVGAFQHDGFTWEVRGAEFIHTDSLSAHSRHFDKALKLWIEDIDMEHRRDFIDAVFDIMEASGAKTLSGLLAEKKKTASAMFERLMSFDKQTRDMIFRTVGELVKANVRASQESLPQVQLPWFGKGKNCNETDDEVKKQ